MSRLGSRLNKLDGGAAIEPEFTIEYIPIEDRPEWPDEVGDFIWSRMGVFYRNEGESVAAFVQRVENANWPPRSVEDLTDDELERSLESIQALIGKMHPEALESAWEELE